MKSNTKWNTIVIEGVFIIISVLIALSADRLIKRIDELDQRRNYIIQLKIDLRKDTTVYQEYVNDLYRKLSVYDSIIKASSTQKMDGLQSYLNQTFEHPWPPMNRTTFDVIKFSNGFALMDNLDLISRLNRYYEADISEVYKQSMLAFGQRLNLMTKNTKMNLVNYDFTFEGADQLLNQEFVNWCSWTKVLIITEIDILKERKKNASELLILMDRDTK
jgi:transcription-repair coupling factor (superfamily II helicase)